MMTRNACIESQTGVEFKINSDLSDLLIRYELDLLPDLEISLALSNLMKTEKTIKVFGALLRTEKALYFFWRSICLEKKQIIFKNVFRRNLLTNGIVQILWSRVSSKLVLQFFSGPLEEQMPTRCNNSDWNNCHRFDWEDGTSLGFYATLEY